jgi:hypothetical protein
MDLLDVLAPNDGLEYLRLQMLGRELTRQISEAEGRGDDARVSALLAQKDGINRRMGDLFDLAPIGYCQRCHTNIYVPFCDHDLVCANSWYGRDDGR